MNYPDGAKIRVGDQLKLWNGCYGTVVCSIDDSEYTPAYTEDRWGYLGSGVLIDSNETGLIHYTNPEDSFQLIARKA